MTRALRYNPKTGKLKMHETAQQIAMVELLQLDFLEADLIFTATQNGANLPKKQKRDGSFYCPEGHKLKMMGMCVGMTDILVWWPIVATIKGQLVGMQDSGFIEVKTPDGELDKEQITFRQRVVAMGGKHAVARSYEQMRAVLVNWGVKCQYRVNL